MKRQLELGNLLPMLDAKVRDGVNKVCKDEGLDTDHCVVERTVHVEKARTNQLDEGSRAAMKYVSTRTCDAEGDLVVPAGIELKEFIKNPVFFWGHNYSLPPLGSDEFVKVDATGLLVKSIYGDTGPGTMAEVVWRLVQQGHQKQSSIGYVPLRAVKKTDNSFGGDLDVLQKSWPELGESRKNVKRILHKVLMLEHSDVGLGMNRDTTVLEVAKSLGATDLLFKQMGFEMDELKAAGVDGVTTDEVVDDDETATDVAALVCPSCGATAKGKPGKLCPKCDEPMKAKGGEDAEKELHAWSGSEPELKSNYKLKHHRDMDKVPVWEDVASCMGLLLGARGGVEVPMADRKAVYDHLAKHYVEFGKDAPEYRDYTQGELRKAFPELYESMYVRPLYVAKQYVREVAVVRTMPASLSVGDLVERVLSKKLGRI